MTWRYKLSSIPHVSHDSERRDAKDGDSRHTHIVDSFTRSLERTGKQTSGSNSSTASKSISRIGVEDRRLPPLPIFYSLFHRGHELNTHESVVGASWICEESHVDFCIPHRFEPQKPAVISTSPCLSIEAIQARLSIIYTPQTSRTSATIYATALMIHKASLPLFLALGKRAQSYQISYPHNMQATEAKYRTAKAELDDSVSQMEGL